MQEINKFLALKDGIGNVKEKIAKFEKNLSLQSSHSLARADKTPQRNSKGSLNR